MKNVILNSAGILRYSPKQGQGFKPPAAPLYPYTQAHIQQARME